MRKRDKVLKASDVFNRTSDRFSTRTNDFDEAYPQIEDLTIFVQQSYDQIRWGPPSVYGKLMLKEFFDCPVRNCYNGGFHIGLMLREMIYNKQTEREVEKPCRGYEGSPKGKKRYGSCLNHYKVKVEIKYKENQQNDVND